VRYLRWLPGLVLLVPWLLGPAAPSNSARIRDLAGPSAFNLLDWETMHVLGNAGALWTGLTRMPSASPGDADLVREYFTQRPHPATLQPQTQAALDRLVAQALEQGGLRQVQPVAVPGLFPPVLADVTAPPNVLVIAPRTELRVIGSTVLQPMDVSAQEQLESSADSTGVSSLVAPIGGLATYPSMVLDDDSAQHVLASIAHEWMHQYLIFYPLGAGYWSSQETREINETTADMVGQEVGTRISASLDLDTSSPSAAPPRRRGAFDFQAFMRETRAHVEQALAAGEVDAAEAYMRSRRDELQQHGYVIRKLNQAYFALYGSYGDGYAASPANPIPSLLHELRGQSPRLADFVAKVRGITTVAQLREAAGQENSLSGVIGQQETEHQT
jgi:hypothetical protein